MAPAAASADALVASRFRAPYKNLILPFRTSLVDDQELFSPWSRAALIFIYLKAYLVIKQAIRENSEKPQERTP